MRPSLAADLNVAFKPPVRQLGGTVPGVEAYGWPGLCPCRLHPHFRQLVGKASSSFYASLTKLIGHHLLAVFNAPQSPLSIAPA